MRKNIYFCLEFGLFLLFFPLYALTACNNTQDTKEGPTEIKDISTIEIREESITSLVITIFPGSQAPPPTYLGEFGIGEFPSTDNNTLTIRPSHAASQWYDLHGEHYTVEKSSVFGNDGTFTSFTVEVTDFSEAGGTNLQIVVSGAVPTALIEVRIGFRVLPEK